MSDVVTRTNCRLCNSVSLSQEICLSPTPPANEFVSDISKTQEEFPLDIYQCQNCGHVQLTTIVDPSRLFENYVYVSGTSPVFVNHFRDYAKSMIKQFDLHRHSVIIDIGSNDGTLLNCFKEEGIYSKGIGFETIVPNLIGFEPALKLCAKSVEDYDIYGIPTFFDDDGLRRFRSGYGTTRADLIVANNVFAHADDLRGITVDILKLLTHKGVFVFEVSYLVDVVRDCLFDTIYHEHLSYHTISPLIKFFDNLGMRMFRVEHIDTHGGSIRCFVDNKVRDIDPSVHTYESMEEGLGYIPNFGPGRCPNPLRKLTEKLHGLKEGLSSRIRELKSQGKKIAGYGAPAKATTLMYQFNLGPNEIDFIVDDNPLKQNLYTPGKHIQVLPSSAINDYNPDYLLILAWNFADSIMEKNKSFSDRGGKFIVPVPELREY